MVDYFKLMTSRWSDGRRITSVLYLELHHPIFRITSVLYLAVGKAIQYCIKSLRLEKDYIPLRK